MFGGTDVPLGQALEGEYYKDGMNHGKVGGLVIPFFHGIRSGYLPENTGDLAGCVGYTSVSPVQV